MTFIRENQFLLGLKNKKQILRSYKKHTAHRKLSTNGNFSTGDKCFTLTAPTTVEEFLYLLISETLQFDLISLKEDIHGRFVAIQALVQEAPFLLLNLYAPTKCSEQCDFFEIISSVLEDMNTDSSYNIILGGDFNVHFNSALDNLGGRMVAKSSVQNIKELMFAHDLVDIWRLQNPETKQFTWSQKASPRLLAYKRLYSRLHL